MLTSHFVVGLISKREIPHKGGGAGGCLAALIINSTES